MKEKYLRSFRLYIPPEDWLFIPVSCPTREDFFSLMFSRGPRLIYPDSVMYKIIPPWHFIWSVLTIGRISTSAQSFPKFEPNSDISSTVILLDDVHSLSLLHSPLLGVWRWWPEQSWGSRPHQLASPQSHVDPLQRHRILSSHVRGRFRK